MAQGQDQAGFLGQGMNSAGDTRPRCGCCQRTSASAPVTRPLPIDLRLVVKDELAAAAPPRAGRPPGPHGRSPRPASPDRRSAGCCGPAVLAWYMARSACFSSSSMDVWWPHEQGDADARGAAVFVTGEQVGLAERGQDFLAHVFRPASPLPRRSRSDLRASPRTRRRPDAPRYRPRARRLTSRCATCCSSRSPLSWPSVSFSVLKLSRSMNSSAPLRRLRALAASACCSRSSSSRRLGSRVSGS